MVLMVAVLCGASGKTGTGSGLLVSFSFFLKMKAF